MTVIAIDFGTKYSSVAARLQDGLIHPLADDHGKIRISSCVAFHKDRVRVGNLADLKRHTNVENTIFDIKTLLGLSPESADALKEKYNWPFKVVSDREKRIALEVHYMGSTRCFYPEEVLAIFLNYLVQIAEKSLGPMQVSGVVITVPSSFNHLKRKAIFNAARIAKIELKELVNDTTAAAIYYSTIPRHALETMVIHIGAGSLAVSICHVTDFSVTVKFTVGELSLGGRDINANIIHDVKPPNEATNLQKMIEDMKTSFCQPSKMHCQMELEYLQGQKEMITIERKTFQKACRPILDRLESAIKKSLEWCHSNRERVSKVILIGGSTRLPSVEQLLNDMDDLREKTDTTRIKTDEIVVLGAGMLAAQYAKSDPNNFGIEEVLTYSIMDTDYELLLSRNTSLSKCQGRAKPVESEEVLKIIDYGGDVMITPGNLYSTYGLKSYITITNDGLISLETTPTGKCELADGLPEEIILQLISRQYQLNQSIAGREAAKKEKYHLQKDAFHVKKEIEKLRNKCVATGELIDKKTDLSLFEVQKERKEFRAVFLRCIENMSATMCYEKEVVATDNYKGKPEKVRHYKTQIRELQKKYEEIETSLNDELEAEKKRSQSLNRMLRENRNQCMKLENELLTARDASEQEMTSLNDELEAEMKRSQLMKRKLRENRSQFIKLEEELQTEKDASKRKMTSLNDELEAEKKRNQSLNGRLRENRNQCIKLEEELQTERDASKREMTSLNDELEAEKRRSQSLNRILRDNRNQCIKLEEELQTEKDASKRERERLTTPALDEIAPASGAEEFSSGKGRRKRDDQNMGSAPRRMPWHFVRDWFSSLWRRIEQAIN